MRAQHVRVEQLGDRQAVLAQDGDAGIDIGTGNFRDHGGSFNYAFKMQIYGSKKCPLGGRFQHC
jgi:hypothetical protein